MTSGETITVSWGDEGTGLEGISIVDVVSGLVWLTLRSSGPSVSSADVTRGEDWETLGGEPSAAGEPRAAGEPMGDVMGREEADGDWGERRAGWTGGEVNGTEAVEAGDVRPMGWHLATVSGSCNLARHGSADPSVCCVSTCRLRSTFLWNARPHAAHANGLNPVCLRLWVIKLDDWLNALPHSRHTYGFSPETHRIKDP